MVAQSHGEKPSIRLLDVIYLIPKRRKNDRKEKTTFPTLAMRFNDADLSALRELSEALNRSQTDVMRVLVREARHILPELKTLAMSHPLTKARPSLAKCQRPRK